MAARTGRHCIGESPCRAQNFSGAQQQAIGTFENRACGCLAAVDRLLPPRSRGWTEDLCACFCAVARFASLPICPNMSNLPLRSLQLAQAPRWCDSHTPSLNLLGLGCVEHGAKARFFSCSVRLAALQQRGRGESIRTSKFLKLFRVICSTSDIYSLCIYIYIYLYLYLYLFICICICTYIYKYNACRYASYILDLEPKHESLNRNQGFASTLGLAPTPSGSESTLHLHVREDPRRGLRREIGSGRLLSTSPV